VKRHNPGFLKLVESALKSVPEIGVEQVRAKLAGKSFFHFFDVREDHEWEAGHAAGAKHLGKGIIERDIESLAPDPASEIVLYCGGGFRSALSADNLQKMGYRNVHSMAGGWRAWVAAGAPIEKAPHRPGVSGHS